MFESYKLKVATENDIENVNEPGVLADMLSPFKGVTYKEKYGELTGFIPDEQSGKASVRKYNATNAAVAADAIVPANHVTLAKNADYNRGFERRMEKYNYAVADDDTVRYCEIFVPLSQISSFFSTNTVIKNTTLEITLKRKGKDNYQNAFYGAANTDVSFGQVATDNTGILSLQLEMLEIIPMGASQAYLENLFANTSTSPKPITFLKPNLESWAMNDNRTSTWTSTSFTVPRYILIGFKGKHTSAQAPHHANNEANQYDSPVKNFSLFAHADLESIQVSINGQQFPNELQKSDIVDENSYSAFYQQYIETCNSLGELPSITSEEFKNLYFIASFDCSNQEPKILNKNTNLSVSVTRKRIPAANTSRLNPQQLVMWIVVLEDKVLQLDAVKNTIKSATVLA